MPIAVICPGCKTRFRVSDRFAGQQGPCPKCKTTIKIPKLTEVKIHAPEETRVNRDSRGRLITRPIFRYETQVSRQLVWITLAAALVILLGALLLGRMFRESFPLQVGVVAALAYPLCWWGYQLLHDRELEPHRGRALLIRTIICSAGYTAMAVAFHFVPDGVLNEPWKWIYFGPLLAAIGTLVAVGCYDLDFPLAFLHFSMFTLSLLILRWAAGMPPIWASGT